MADVGCIVLAAGAGRRFGGVKQLAHVRGKTMLEWVLDTALAVPALDPVVVVLGAHAPQIRAAIDFSDLRVVEAVDWQEGQGASLRAGIATVGDVDAAVVLLSDMPFVTAQVVAGALEHWSPRWDALRTTYGGRPGHPVVLGRRLLHATPELRGDAGARELMRDLRFRVREWEAGHLCDPTDIDTAAQLEALS